MADQIPPADGMPTWLVAVLSVAGTVAGWRIWRPIGRWIDRRLEVDRQAAAMARGDMIAQLNTELKSSREENVQLRQELAEERELRMTFAQDYAVLKRDVEHLTKAMVEDKRDCERAIRRLNGEIRRLQTEVSDLRAQQRSEEA